MQYADFFKPRHIESLPESIAEGHIMQWWDVKQRNTYISIYKLTSKCQYLERKFIGLGMKDKIWNTG